MSKNRRKSIPRIAEAEYKILEYLWNNAPSGSRQIHEGLEAENWNIQTVKTLLSRLVDKKAVSYSIEGRNYIYFPLVKRNDYVVEKSRNLIDKMFQGSIKAMVSNLVESEMVSEDELNELKQFLDEQGGPEVE